MPMPASEIEALIKAAIPDAEVTIRDLAGDGDHYAARVVSGSFAGLSRVGSTRRSIPRSGGAWGVSFTRCSSKPQCRNLETKSD